MSGFFISIYFINWSNQNLNIMTKKLLISGLTGSSVYYLLGYLAYEVLFAKTTTGEHSPLGILLGCLFYAFLLAFVLIKYGTITQFKEGLKAGFILGLLYALSWYFFNFENTFELLDFVKQISIETVLTSLVGGAIAFTHGKFK